MNETEILMEIPCAVDIGADSEGRIRFLTAVDGGGKVYGGCFDTGETAITEQAQFEMCELPYGSDAVRLKSGEGGFVQITSYDNLDNGNRLALHSDALWIQPWERFVLCVLMNGKVALRTANGHYVSAVSNIIGLVKNTTVKLTPDKEAGSLLRIIPLKMKDIRYGDDKSAALSAVLSYIAGRYAPEIQGDSIYFIPGSVCLPSKTACETYKARMKAHRDYTPELGMDAFFKSWINESTAAFSPEGYNLPPVKYYTGELQKSGQLSKGIIIGKYVKRAAASGQMPKEYVTVTPENFDDMFVGFKGLRDYSPAGTRIVCVAFFGKSRVMKLSYEDMALLFSPSSSAGGAKKAEIMEAGLSEMTPEFAALCEKSGCYKNGDDAISIYLAEYETAYGKTGVPAQNCIPIHYLEFIDIAHVDFLEKELAELCEYIAANMDKEKPEETPALEASAGQSDAQTPPMRFARALGSPYERGGGMSPLSFIPLMDAGEPNPPAPDPPVYGVPLEKVKEAMAKAGLNIHQPVERAEYIKYHFSVIKEHNILWARVNLNKPRPTGMVICDKALIYRGDRDGDYIYAHWDTFFRQQIIVAEEDGGRVLCHGVEGIVGCDEDFLNFIENITKLMFSADELKLLTHLHSNPETVQISIDETPEGAAMQVGVMWGPAADSYQINANNRGNAFLKGNIAELFTVYVKRLMLKAVSHDGPNNIKNGPDVIINGVPCQFKVGGDAGTLVRGLFSGGTYRYSGMELYVPNGMGKDVIEKLSAMPDSRFQDGARPVVKEMTFSAQSFEMMCKFGTLQSLAFSSVQSVSAAVPAFLLCSGYLFITDWWTGESTALESAGKAGRKALGSLWQPVIFNIVSDQTFKRLRDMKWPVINKNHGLSNGFAEFAVVNFDKSMGVTIAKSAVARAKKVDYWFKSTVFTNGLSLTWSVASASYDLLGGKITVKKYRGKLTYACASRVAGFATTVGMSVVLSALLPGYVVLNTFIYAGAGMLMDCAVHHYILGHTFKEEARLFSQKWNNFANEYAYLNKLNITECEKLAAYIKNADIEKLDMQLRQATNQTKYLSNLMEEILHPR